MLRITVEESPEQVRLRLEGKLASAWVDELERTVAEANSFRAGRSIVVDLAGLTAADNAGRYLLRLMECDGVHFENANSFQMWLPASARCRS